MAQGFELSSRGLRLSIKRLQICHQFPLRKTQFYLRLVALEVRRFQPAARRSPIPYGQVESCHGGITEIAKLAYDHGLGNGVEGSRGSVHRELIGVDTVKIIQV